jgi:hypothetical protein
MTGILSEEDTSICDRDPSKSAITVVLGEEREGVFLFRVFRDLRVFVVAFVPLAKRFDAPA